MGIKPELDSVDHKRRSTIDMTYRCMQEGTHGLSSVPGLLRQIIEEGMWQEFFIPNEPEPHKPDSFAQFVTDQPPKGLATTIEMIKNICHEHTDLLDTIDQLCQRQLGINQHSEGFDNIQTLPPDGTSKEAGLRRLRREIDKASDNPDKQANIRALQQKVFAHEISIHKALVTIGARRETFTIPIDPKPAARAIAKRFTPEQIGELVKLLCTD